MGARHGGRLQEGTEIVGGAGLLTLLPVLVLWVLTSIKAYRLVPFSDTSVNSAISGKLLFFDCFFFFLSRLHAQPGAWNHSPEMESCTLYRLSQPGALSDTSGKLLEGTRNKVCTGSPRESVVCRKAVDAQQWLQPGVGRGGGCSGQRPELRPKALVPR